MSHLIADPLKGSTDPSSPFELHRDTNRPDGISVWGRLNSLLPLGGVHHGDAAVVGHTGQLVPTGGEGDTVNPASTVLVLQQHLPKRHFGPPSSRSRLVFDVLDVG